MYKTIIIPVLLYGSRTRIRNSKDVNLKFLKSVKEFTRIRGIKKEDIQKVLHAYSVNGVVYETQKKWLTHLEIMDSGRLPKLPFHYKPNGCSDIIQRVPLMSQQA
jgi:hypothetical protein